MSVRQSLLWLGSGVVFLVLSLFPWFLVRGSEALGFAVPSNAAFAGWLLVLTVLVFYQSLTTSRQSDHVKALCQEIAILKALLGDALEERSGASRQHGGAGEHAKEGRP